MTTTTQRAANSNTEQTHVLWQEMSFHKSKKALAGNGVKTGSSDCYRIIVRPKEQFASFKTQAIGNPGSSLQRLAGRRRNSGTWATQAWLVNKSSAHIEGKTLVADSKDVRDLIRQLGSKPQLEYGDIFTTRIEDTHNHE
jgi:hypothetical protein